MGSPEIKMHAADLRTSSCCLLTLLDAEIADNAEEELLRKSPQVIPFPDPPAGMLFATVDRRDEEAHERVGELLEDVLATSPRRRSSAKKRERKAKVRLNPSRSCICLK